MTKPLVKQKSHKLCLIFLLALTGNVYSADVSNFSNSTHAYTSYKEFASTICLPCHYPGIANGTDLMQLYPQRSEEALKNILLPILKEGHMPPNKIYREILYNKFLQIESLAPTTE